jgi:hypothetical protein
MDAAVVGCRSAKKAERMKLAKPGSVTNTALGQSVSFERS